MMLGRRGRFAIHESLGVLWKFLGRVILGADPGSQLLYLGQSGPKVPTAGFNRETVWSDKMIHYIQIHNIFRGCPSGL